MRLAIILALVAVQGIQAPGALGTDESDVPTLTVYLPRTMVAGTPAISTRSSWATRSVRFGRCGPTPRIGASTRPVSASSGSRRGVTSP